MDGFFQKDAGRLVVLQSVLDAGEKSAKESILERFDVSEVSLPAQTRNVLDEREQCRSAEFERFKELGLDFEGVNKFLRPSRRKASAVYP